jgi:hypothetical protein
MKRPNKIGNYVDEILSIDSSIAGYLVDFFGSDVISEFEKYARLSESISTQKRF